MCAAGNEKHGRNLLYPRAYLALVLLAAAFALALLLDPLTEVFRSEVDEGYVGDGSENSLFLGNALALNADGLSVEPDRVLAGFDDQPPGGFADEVMDAPDGKYSFDADGVIAGFLFREGLPAAAEDVSLLLERRGWRAVSSGQNSLVTFVKNRGEFRWAAVSFESSSGGTSVVVNARRHENGQG